MLIDRRNWSPHLPWIALAVIATVLATLWFFYASLGRPDWPPGSSFPGFTFGILGGLIILFEFALWGKKKVRTWRIGRAQVWMRAHIWLGLLTIPLLVYHSGFRLGGTLSTVLMVLLFLVVLSGIWGLVLQQILPQRMLEQIPAETIYSQIDHVVGQLVREADRLVLATCGPPEGDESGGLDSSEFQEATTGHLVVGAVRSAGRVQGRVLETRAPSKPIPGCEPLRVFFRNTVASYLQTGDPDSPLHSANRAGVLFGDLRTKLDPGAHETVAALESLCDQRRQLEVQSRMHFWLHNWLWLHLPLSLALVVLMLVHVFVALKYW